MMTNSTRSYFTPLNEADENCERTLATLRIYPGEINIQEVTEALGISPTSSVTKSERIPTHVPGQFRTGKLNGWFLSSEGLVESKDLRSHLDWLLVKLEARAAGLNMLQRRPGVRMCVYCIWWSRHGGGGPSLWPEQMRKPAALDLECTFDFQYYGDDQEGQKSRSSLPSHASPSTSSAERAGDGAE